jgi:hypothetical protein
MHSAFSACCIFTGSRLRRLILVLTGWCLSRITTDPLPASRLLYDWRSVSRYVLVSSTLVGLMTRYYFLSECCRMKFTVLYLWGALSDERMGLQFAVKSLNGPSRAEPVTILYCLILDSPNLEGQVSSYTFGTDQTENRDLSATSIGYDACYGVFHGCSTVYIVIT